MCKIIVYSQHTTIKPRVLYRDGLKPISYFNMFVLFQSILTFSFKKKKINGFFLVKSMFFFKEKLKQSRDSNCLNFLPNIFRLKKKNQWFFLVKSFSFKKN